MKNTNEATTYRSGGKTTYVLHDLALEKEMRPGGAWYRLRLALGDSVEVSGSGASPAAAMADLKDRMTGLAHRLGAVRKALKYA